MQSQAHDNYEQNSKKLDTLPISNKSNSKFEINELNINACILLPMTRTFSKYKLPVKFSQSAQQKLNKKAKKLFTSGGISPTRLNIIQSNQPLIFAEFESSLLKSNCQEFESRLQKGKYNGTVILWTTKKKAVSFCKAVSVKPTSPSESLEALPDKEGNIQENVKGNFKTNDKLRGTTTGLLLKNLPKNIKHQNIKSSLPFRIQSLKLFKKSGQRTCMLSFSTAAECTAAFDALYDFELEGHKVVKSFVLPRAQVTVDDSKKLLESISEGTKFYYLNVTNIPFATTLETLKEAFPTADNVYMRRRKDGKSKGSCILSFTDNNDREATRAACRNKEIDGRRIVCRKDDPDETSVIAETASLANEKREKNVEGCQLKLLNLPYSTTREELKKVFPQSRHIYLPEVQGSANGIAIISFKTPTICQEALHGASKLKLQNRKIRSEINVSVKRQPVFDTDKQDQPDCKRPRKHSRSKSFIRKQDTSKETGHSIPNDSMDEFI